MVSQTRTACSTAIASPGTVSNSLNQKAANAQSVLIGQTNQAAGTTWVEEGTLGTAKTLAGTITFTLSGAGVTFSGSPTASPCAIGTGIPGGGPCVPATDLNLTVVPTGAALRCPATCRLIAPAAP